MDILHATKKDMQLGKYLPLTLSPKEIPITYKIGETVYQGLPKCFQPKVKRTTIDTNITQYVFTGRSPEGLLITVEMLAYHDFPVVEWIAYFENDNNTPSPIVSNIRWETVIKGKNPILTHSNGDNCREDGYEIFTEVLKDKITLQPCNGFPNCGAFPYMRLTTDEFFMNIALGWTGSWIAEFLPNVNGVSLSIGQSRCYMKILPGETMRTPRMTFMVAGESDDHARNLWRKWYFAHVLPKENGEAIPPKKCMHVYGVDGEEFTGATTSVQIEGIKNYIEKEVKPDVWWMDAGWYPCDHHWYPTVGTWRCDTERFPNGLGEIGEFCEDNGVQFLLWFEPERVREHTELWNDHREWLLSFEGSENYLLNLGNPEALHWIIERVNSLIDEYHVNIYRQDCNFWPMPFWEANEAPDRIGAMENLHVQGYLAYWDSLIDHHPGLLIDSCAGGGRRNDLDTMRRAVTLHYTDIGYGNHPIKQKQHRLMFEWIPYFRAHNMSWDKPDGTYGSENHSGDEFSFHCALAPSITDMLFYKAPEEQFEISRKMTPIWRRAAELELRGEYYPLTECRRNPQDWYAMQFDDPERNDGFVQVIRNTLVEEDVYTLHMKAIKQDAEYFFENMENGDTMQVSGTELLKGIPLKLEKRSGIVLFYRKENGKAKS